MEGAQEVPLHKLREHLGERVDAAHYTGETTIITRHGRPRALLVPIPEGEGETQIQRLVEAIMRRETIVDFDAPATQPQPE